MTYLIFTAKDQVDGHIHGILGDNLSILDTYVHLDMTNKSLKKIPTFCHKNDFPF